MAIWSAVRLQPYRQQLALSELARAGFETYAPRILRCRHAKGRKIETMPLLFPGYIFVLIVLQWHAARFAPGVIGLIMDGERPARVPDAVIDGLRSRDRNGVITLPKKPEPGSRVDFQSGERLRIRTGPLRGLFGLYAGQAPHDRIMVLMQILGASRPIEFAVGDVSRA
jgi:transcription antitermination factor NusG